MATTWILSTVGKSMLDNWKKWMEKSPPSNNGGADLDNPSREQLEDYLFRHLTQLIDCSKNGTLPNEIPSAELQTLWLLFRDWHQNKPGVQHSVHIALFPTEVTSIYAHAIIHFLNSNKDRLELAFPGVIFEHVDEEGDLRICDMSPDTASFAKGIANLAREIRQYIDKKSDMPGTFYIDPTGGFKAVWMIWPLVGALYEEAVFIYSHFTSSNVIRLPRFPLGPDLGVLEELHSFLQPDGISSDVCDSLPPQAQSLFNTPSEGVCKPNFFGDMFADLYEKRNVALHGSGSILLRQIGSEELRRTVKRYMPDWQNVWMGDQLPETVEHGKRHSLRLMEFTLEALPALNRKAIGGDAGLFVLFASLWLHDIGHTAISFNANNHGEEIIVPIDMFPSLVRNWHAESSSRLIGDTDHYISAEDGRDLVALVARYHRQRMPLRKKDIKPVVANRDEMLQPPQESLEQAVDRHLSPGNTCLRPELQGLTVDNIVAIEALLRFLDATDVQAARAFDESYAKARLRRTNNEVECLMGRLQDISMTNASWLELTKLSNEVREAVRHWQSLDVNAITCPPEPSTLLRRDGHIGDFERRTLAMLSAVLGFGDDYHADVNKLAKELCFVALEELSLIDRILFKYRQHIHFQKHASVEYCWYHEDRNGKLRVYLKPENSWSCFAPEIAKDIYKEVAAMHGELQKVLPFDGVWNATTQLRFPEDAGSGATSGS